MAVYSASSSASNSSPPHIMILLGVVGVMLAVPSVLAGQPSLAEVLGDVNPAMAMAAPVLLVVIIRWISDKNYNVMADVISNATDSSSIHRVGGSPVGLALLILAVLGMIWHKSSGEDSG